MHMQVAEGVHRLTQGVSNFYLVEDGGRLVLVDAGASGDWGLFARELEALGRKSEDLDAVLVTHAHSDHTGFAERARTAAGATVWIHQADVAEAKGAKAPKNDRPIFGYLLRGEAWRTVWILVKNGGTKIVPIQEVSAFADGETVDAPGRPRVVHVPGHTPGMSALLFESRRVVMTGDALVTRNPLTGATGPQIAPSALNRDSQQALRSLDALAALPADIVLPGHGDPWTGGVADAVVRAKAAGLS
jgi:glyoxylase-like metal-dependent hydrolase (beta-lactamase superfamily II)